MAKFPAVLYARFSPRRESAGCDSNARQIERCRRWCAEHGHHVEAVYEDAALSGSDAQRPGLWAAVSALQRGSVLVVWSFDRLARDGFLSYTIEHEILRRGARAVSVSGEGEMSNALTAEERLKLGILRLFAEYQRGVIRARTRAAMRRHQAEGRRMSAVAPYGWGEDETSECAACGRHRRLRQEPGEQVVIRRILVLCQEGEGLRAIARRLAAEGVLCRGGPWRHSTVKAILRRAQALNMEDSSSNAHRTT